MITALFLLGVPLPWAFLLGALGDVLAGIALLCLSRACLAVPMPRFWERGAYAERAVPFALPKKSGGSDE